MAFNGLMLTNDGRTLYAKAQQGKPLHITRVALGDGIIGSGSLINRSALISERVSLLVDALQVVNEVEAAIVATLSNEGITTGFYFREIGVFARDPDTLQEKCYLYDASGTDGEYIPDNQSPMRVYERLKLLVTLENTPNVTFTASGNPLYMTPDEVPPLITAHLKGLPAKATIQAADKIVIGDSDNEFENKTVTFSQIRDGVINTLPTEDSIADADQLSFYDASTSSARKTAWSNIKAKMKAYFDTIYTTVATITSAVSTHNTSTTAHDTRFAAKADLVGGKIPGSQLPAMNYMPLSGGTMTGALTLQGNPTANLHAVPKQYVDGGLLWQKIRNLSDASATGNISISVSDIDWNIWQTIKIIGYGKINSNNSIVIRANNLDNMQRSGIWSVAGSASGSSNSTYLVSMSSNYNGQDHEFIRFELNFSMLKQASSSNDLISCFGNYSSNGNNTHVIVQGSNEVPVLSSINFVSNGGAITMNFKQMSLWGIRK